ncbi:MAG: 3'-5' exonuclease [Pseudobdellovibrio sp.]
MDQSEQQLKRISFSGNIHLINNDQELEAVAAELNSAIQLGFDTETKPSFKKGEVYKVALLQLSTETNAYLIRLHYITNHLIIKNIFESDKILKVGVAIRDDIKQLQKHFQFEPKNFIELQDVAKDKGLKNFGLKGMAAEVMNGALSKGPKMTNWELPILTEPQLMYAATDAWIGLALYLKIKD